MSSKELPSRPNLDQYKKQAKDLLKSYRAGDPDALNRISETHPEFKKTPIDEEAFGLSDAQWVIAREHGFESWPKFVSHIRSIALNNSEIERIPALSTIDLDIQTPKSTGANSPQMENA